MTGVCTRRAACASFLTVSENLVLCVRAKDFFPLLAPFKRSARCSAGKVGIVNTKRSNFISYAFEFVTKLFFSVYLIFCLYFFVSASLGAVAEVRRSFWRISSEELLFSLATINSWVIFMIIIFQMAIYVVWILERWAFGCSNVAKASNQKRIQRSGGFLREATTSGLTVVLLELTQTVLSAG